MRYEIQVGLKLKLKNIENLINEINSNFINISKESIANK